MDVIVVPKEKAVFWMDANGRWCNEFGKFEKKKIIDYFNRSINRDEDGYFVCQEKEGVIEKVYFRYADTALFVFDIRFGDSIELVLNTGKNIEVDPERLWIENDNLYTVDGNDRIKFSDRALMKISKILEEREEGLLIRINNKVYPVPEMKSEQKKDS
ncbi:MAG: MFS transporter permease [Desulfobacterales bacterium]